MKKKMKNGIIGFITALAMLAPSIALPVTAEDSTAAEHEAWIAEEEARRAEEEQAREEAEKEREERRAERGLPVSGGPAPTRPPMPSDGGLSLMESEYSEIVYISNVEELLAIDGHTGGYYELTEDIDISGMNWATLYLEDATFNGNGHTISGLTITEEPGVKQFSEIVTDPYGNTFENTWEQEVYDVGFIVGGDNYVYDLELSGVNIDLELTTMEYPYISAIGAAYADNCTVRGEVHVTVSSGLSYSNVCGINTGTDSRFSGNITLSGNGDVYGIYAGERNYMEGDIVSDNCSAGGIHGGNNNTLIGDVSGVSNASGISDGEGNYMEGDIASYNGFGFGINGDNNTLIGNVTAENGVYGINEGEGNYMEGDAVSYNDSAYGIFRGDNSMLIGNVTADNGACGIYWGVNSALVGDVTTNNGWAEGISEGERSYMEGNVVSYNGDVHGIYTYYYETHDEERNYIKGDVISYNGNAYGIDGVINSTIIGNVTANNGDVCGFGIRSDGCYISGAITETAPDSPTLTVTASSPYQGYFVCEHCNTGIVSSNDLCNTVHCYTYDIYFGETVYRSPHYYYASNTLFYSNDTVGMPPDTEATPPPTPSPQPATYSVQVVDEQSGGPIEGAEVTIGGTSHTTDENGVIVLKDAPRSGGLRIDYGGSVIYTDASFTAIPDRMNVISVKPLYLDKEDLFAGNNDGTVIKGPKVKIAGYEVPTFEVPFSMDYELFDSLKMVYDAEERQFQVLIGMENELADVALDANSDSWKKAFDEFKREYNSSKEDRNYKSNTGAPGTIGISGSLDTRGFMEIEMEEDGSMSVNGGVVVTLTGEAEYTQYVTPGVYLVFSLEGELGGELKWELVNSSVQDPKINFLGTITAGLTPGVGVGAGVRALLALEMGLRGELGVEYTFPGEKFEDSIKAELSASFYATVYALNHPFEHSQTFASLQLYPEFGAAEAALDEPDMYTINREYLNEISLFADDPDTFKTNLYPYSEVKTARLGDGRIIAVWTDDDTARNSMDRTALYYSIYENGAWSAAEQINNDGTGDYEFDLRANGNTAAIVWQNAERQLPDDISVDDNAAAVGLSYAVFDGAAWGEPVSVTVGNAGYEYSPSLYYDGNTGYIAWMENGRNTAFPAADDVIDIYGVSVSDGTVGEKTAEYEDMLLVYEIAAGADGSVACIADADGDMNTADGVLYADGMECHKGSATLAGLEYTDGGFCFSENGTLRKSDGASSYARLTGEFAENTVPRLITNGETGAKAVVYEVQDEFSSNLYASYYTDGSWSDPVKITDHTEKLRSWSAELDADGNVIAAAVLASIDMEGDELKQSARLSFETAEPKEEIEVLYISTDGAAPGETAEFEIGVRNDSLAKTLNVTITDESGAVLYSGTEESAEVITVRTEIPEGFAKQTVTAYVDGAENEADTSDNSASVVFGGADLAVELRAGGLQTIGSVSAVVRNKGCEAAENAVLRLKDADGNVTAEESLGTIAGGEKRTVRIETDAAALIAAEVISDTEETADWNNSTYVRTSETDGVSLRLESESISMAPGESCAAAVTVYPEGANAAIYGVSSDETVVTVDENGMLTAVGEGTAEVTYMTPGSMTSVKQTVNVREKGTPEITAAEYIDNGNENYEVSVTVSTAGCLAEGETELLAAAVYAGDGTLIGLETYETTASEADTVNMYVSGKRPVKVKVMLWNGLEGMKPVSYAAERALTAAGG